MKSTRAPFKVLITGAGGFLGTHIVKELIAQGGYEIHSFSRSSYPHLKILGVLEHLGDLSDYSTLYTALKNIRELEAIIHAAGKVGVWGKRKDFYQTNVVGTENLLKAMKELNIKKLVYTSTPSVAFGRVALCGVDETTPYPEKKDYLSGYALTKSIAEQIVLKANCEDLATVALRPHLIFGPGDLNLIPRVLEANKKGRLKIIGDGNNLVDVTYVVNAAKAHCMALQKLDFSHPIAGKAYFLGQGPVKLWDFINTILKKEGQDPVTKKISLKSAYLLGFIVECFLKFFRIESANPPMTRFIALQLGTSHYFNHRRLEQDLGFKAPIPLDKILEEWPKMKF